MANLSKIKLSGTTYNIVDSTAIHNLDDYSTTAQMNAAITAATSALAESIAEQDYQTETEVQNAITAATTPINNTLTAHTANTTVHVTQANKNAWNAKLDASDIASLFGFVEYDSTTNRINFYKDSTKSSVLAYVDASPFLVDGFLDSVEIKTISGAEYLVFTWNSDSGKQTSTNIPLTSIFNPNNYYTKTQVNTELAKKANTATTYTKTETDTAISNYTYDKATIDEKVAEGGTFDPTLYYNKTETDALLDDKQDTLVSGTNIKSVGGNTLLGSGNVALMLASIGTGADSETLIFNFA